MSKLIHNILEYNLLSIQDYTFTVYDLLRLFIYFLIAKTIL